LVGATRGSEEKSKTTGEIPSNLEEATGGKENPATGDADPEDADPKVIESSEENEDFFETTSRAETAEGMDRRPRIKALDRCPRISRICPNTPGTLSFCNEVSPSTTATPDTQAEQLTQTLELRRSSTRRSLPRGSGACFSMAEQSTGSYFFKSHHPATDLTSTTFATSHEPNL
jgi:hypothetical protein